MKYVLTIVVFALMTFGGCSDRYRYKCQDPDHFGDADCQKPKCLFTQICPEYLVAPVLEKAIAPQSPASSDR
jgi:hypothetical protein